MKFSAHIFNFIIILSFFLISCSGNNEGELQPLLSSDNVTLTEGESTTITVTNATIISAKASNDIVSLSVNKNYIKITAIKAGETTISISAGRHKLSCNVSITKSGGNNNTGNDEPSPNNKPDYSIELLNSTSRYTSATISIVYDSPGIIFSIENNNHITINDLNTDDTIDFSFMGEAKPGNLNQPRLIVNGSTVSITDASIEQLTAEGMWIHITSTDENHIWLVATDI